MNSLEPSYADLEETPFSRAALLADCQEYCERFLAHFQPYNHDSPVHESDTYLLSNGLSIRTWLAYLLDYLYHDDPATREREIQYLDAALLAQMPRVFVQGLGSWDDHEYRCMELEPVTHWWCYREGYAAQNYDFG